MFRLLNLFALYTCYICAAIFAPIYALTALADSPSHAVEIALENNFDIASAKVNLEANAYDKYISASEFLPSLSASANTTWNKSTTEQSPDADIKNSYNEHGYRLTLSQKLFDLGRLFRFSQARKTYSIEELRFENTRQKVISTAFTSYIEALKLYARKHTTQLELDSAFARLDQVTKNVNAGNTARSSLFEAQAKASRVHTSLIDIELKLQVALNELAKESGYRVHPSYDIDPAMKIETIDATAQSLFESEMQKQNLDILIARHSLEKSKSELSEKRAGFAPTISADINYAFSDTNNAASKTPPATGDSDSTSYRVTLNLPIFSGGERIFSARKAKLLTNKAQIDLDNEVASAHLALQELVLSINADARSIEMLKASIIANNKSFVGQKKAYDLGTRTLSDVLSAEKLLYDSVRSYFDTLYDYVNNLIEVQALLGALNLDTIKQVNAGMRVRDPKATRFELKELLAAISQGERS